LQWQEEPALQEKKATHENGAEYNPRPHQQDSDGLCPCCHVQLHGNDEVLYKETAPAKRVLV
jgi:hypothetical protein